jgi:hypothetical protein
MIPLVIGSVLAAAALIWVIAPVFAEEPHESRGEAVGAARDAAAEAAIQSWRTPR